MTFGIRHTLATNIYSDTGTTNDNRHKVSMSIPEENGGQGTSRQDIRHIPFFEPLAPLRHQTLSTAPLPSGTGENAAFPLMRLPPELRLRTYDQVFTDLTIGRQSQVADVYTYHHGHEWPGNDFSDYLNLLLASKHVHDEAKPLWEHVYILQACFYFLKPPSFHRVAKSLATLGEPYTNAKYVLWTAPKDENASQNADWIDEEGEDFMAEQPGFPSHDPNYAQMSFSWPEIPYARGEGQHYLLPSNEIPVEIYSQGPERKLFGRAIIPGLEDCTLIFHERHAPPNYAGTDYMLMTGEMGGVFWGAYDLPFSKAKWTLWEAWEKKGFPGSCLSKANLVLVHQAQLELGIWDVWRRNGNSPQDEEDTMLKIEELYGLRDWLRTVE